MNRALIKKCINEAKWLLLACGTCMFAFCYVRVWIISRLDTDRFKKILDLLPEDWQRFSPVDFEWLITYPGRLSLTYDEPIVFLCVAIWAIARGSDCISGEIGRGTMEMLLAQPVSRFQVLATHSTVTVLGIVVLVSISFAATYVGIHTNTVKEEITPTWNVPGFGFGIPNVLAKKETREVSLSEKVDVTVLLPAVVNLFSLGLFLAGISALMSSWDRYRWRTIGIVVGIFIVQLIVKIVGLASDDFAWMLNLSVLTAYEPEAFVKVADQFPEEAWNFIRYGKDGGFTAYGPMANHCVLAGFGIGSYIGATIFFLRRDLPAPL